MDGCYLSVLILHQSSFMLHWACLHIYCRLGCNSIIVVAEALASPAGALDWNVRMQAFAVWHVNADLSALKNTALTKALDIEWEGTKCNTIAASWEINGSNEPDRKRTQEECMKKSFRKWSEKLFPQISKSHQSINVINRRPNDSE